MSQPLDPAGAEGALIRAAMAGDDALADAIAERFPGVRRDSPACALLLADPSAADRLTEASVNAAVDPSDWPPLLLLCSSRYRSGLGEARRPGGKAAGAGCRSQRRDP